MERKPLTEMETQVFEFVKANGGKVTIDEIAEGVGRAKRSVNANITGLAKENKGCLVEREKVTVDGETVTYVVLTEAGKEYTA